MRDFDDDYLSPGFSSNSRSPWEALTPSPSPSGISDGDSVNQLAPEIEEVRSWIGFVVPLAATDAAQSTGQCRVQTQATQSCGESLNPLICFVPS